MVLDRDIKTKDNVASTALARSSQESVPCSSGPAAAPEPASSQAKFFFFSLIGFPNDKPILIYSQKHINKRMS